MKMKKEPIILIYVLAGLSLILILIAVSIVVKKTKPSIVDTNSMMSSSEKLTPTALVNQDIISVNATENLSDALPIIKSSDDLINLLNNNFTLEPRDSYTAYSPNEFYQLHQGNSFDFAIFSQRLLKSLGLEAGILRYDYVDDMNQPGSRAVVVFREGDIPKYLAFNPEGILSFTDSRSFADVINNEEDRLQLKAARYTYFTGDSYDFSDAQAPFTWVDLK